MGVLRNLPWSSLLRAQIFTTSRSLINPVNFHVMCLKLESLKIASEYGSCDQTYHNDFRYVPARWTLCIRKHWYINPRLPSSCGPIVADKSRWSTRLGQKPIHHLMTYAGLVFAHPTAGAFVSIVHAIRVVENVLSHRFVKAKAS